MFKVKRALTSPLEFFVMHLYVPASDACSCIKRFKMDNILNKNFDVNAYIHISIEFLNDLD